MLDKAIAAGHPLVITSAVRDEGTSYHYLPPAREVTANPLAVAVLETVLRERGLDYRTGKAWTTDAIYRETVTAATGGWRRAARSLKWKRQRCLPWRSSAV